VADPNAQRRRRWPLGDHGLTIVLASLFLASWVGQFFVEMVKVGNEARSHGEAFTMSEFWPSFWQSTLENWQSECPARPADELQQRRRAGSLRLPRLGAAHGGPPVVASEA
jgi:hypothetical protein